MSGEGLCKIPEAVIRLALSLDPALHAEEAFRDDFISECFLLSSTIEAFTLSSKGRKKLPIKNMASHFTIYYAK